MRNKTMLFIFFAIIFCSCSAQNKKINGVSFVASRDHINTIHTTPVQKASANYVTLMPFGFMKRKNSPEIDFNTQRHWYGETNEGINQYAKEFQKKGIKIMIKPQIWIWGGAYTGHVTMNSYEDWKMFENNYESFILNYAKIAEELNASVFCIGTELEKFVINRPEYWISVIKKIRKVYSGKITYAANWDEFKRVPFWGDLDFIGIDAYFPVSDKKSPTVEDFEAGWRLPKKQIAQKQKEYQKPVLFTEFGYRSINYTGRQPWESSKVIGKINLEAQKNGLQAIYNQFWKEDWFAGGFLWKWYHKHSKAGGENNNRFTPQNKPAEQLIKQLYGN